MDGSVVDAPDTECQRCPSRRLWNMNDLGDSDLRYCRPPSRAFLRCSRRALANRVILWRSECALMASLKRDRKMDAALESNKDI
jgi:hypothetical protein